MEIRRNRPSAKHRLSQHPKHSRMVKGLLENRNTLCINLIIQGELHYRRHTNPIVNPIQNLRNSKHLPQKDKTRCLWSYLINPIHRFPDKIHTNLSWAKRNRPVRWWSTRNLSSQHRYDGPLVWCLFFKSTQMGFHSQKCCFHLRFG